MTRRAHLIVACLLGASLAAAPAWAAARSACQTPTKTACCCPQGVRPQRCPMDCFEPPPSDKPAALAPSPLASVFKGTYALEPTPDTSATAATPLLLADVPHRTAHAPPPKRYLLACVLRL